jgi:glycosyltransferase involved in cell wall biosynthesis
MHLSIIIPVGDDPDGLAQTLDSLLPEVRSQHDIEVIVANDGGHAGVEKICRDREVKCLSIRPNRGSYNARNEGADVALGEVLGFIDAGITVCPGWCAMARQAAVSADYIAGDIRHGPLEHDGAVAIYQDLFSFKIERLFSEAKFGPTANVVVRKDVFVKAGKFDGRLRSSGDLEFGSRLASAGSYRQCFDVERYVVHPYRSLEGILKKQMRLVMGTRHLARLHPERFSSRLIGRGARLKLLLPPAHFWLLYPGRSGRGIGPSEVARLREASLTTRVGVYLVAYAVKLATWVGYASPLKNPDAFEWKVEPALSSEAPASAPAGIRS